MIAVILVNALFLAMYDPVANYFNQPSWSNKLLVDSEVYFIVIYTVEMLLHIVAYGFYPEGPYTFLKNGWFVLDFLIVLLGWVGLALDHLLLPQGAPVAINAIRTLRPLRILQYIPKVNILERTLLRSRKMLCNVCILFMLFAFTFSLVGLAAFNGKLHQKCGWNKELNQTEWFVYAPTSQRFCSLDPLVGTQCPSDAVVVDPDTGNNRSVVCVSEFNFPGDNVTVVNPWGGWTGYDNLAQSFLTTFIIVTQDGWSDYMNAYRDTNGDASQIFFILIEIVCSTILLSLLIAVMVVNLGIERKRVEEPELFDKENLDLTALAHVDDMLAEAEQRKRLSKVKAAKLASDMELRLIWSYRRHRNEPNYTTVNETVYRQYLTRHTPEEIDAFGTRLFAAQKARQAAKHPEAQSVMFSRQVQFSNNNRVTAVGSEGSEAGSEGVPEFLPDVETGPDLAPAPVPGLLPRGERPGAWTITRLICRLVKHPLFGSFMVVVILFNTALLMTVHFMQPIWLFQLQELGNIALTGVFTIEMILKLIGLGVRTYVREPFDLFDGFIVTISWVDIIITHVTSASNSFLTILRTMRVLRVFKIMRYLPAAARLLRILGLTLWASLPFCGLFLVWMYVFTVSGLLIFGANMDLPPYVVDTTTGDMIQNYEWTCTRYAGGFYTANYTRCPAGSNYDTLVWAVVTSVQLLTKENWSDIMIHACTTANTWVPVIYFLVVIVMGTYVVLNLFIAVIIDSFLQSMEKIQQRILLRNNSSAKSAGALASDGASSEISEDEDMPLDFKKWAESKLVNLDGGDLRRKVRVTDLPPFISNSASLFVIPAHNPVRIALATFITSKIVEYFIIGVILMACALLIIETPANANDPTLIALDYFVDAVFFFECTCKVVAFGFVLNTGAYLRSGWNQLDFVIVVATVLDLALANNPAFQAVRALRALRPLRLIAKIEGAKVAVIAMLKSLRPVCVVAAMVLVFLVIFALFAVGLYGGLFYSCLDASQSSYGVYYDSLVDVDTGYYMVDRLCFPYRDYDVEGCPPQDQCVGAGGEIKWDMPSYSRGGGTKYGFDDIGESIMLLWEVSLLSLWLEPMRRTTSATNVGHQPVRDASVSNSVFFIVFIFTFSFFFTQLFVAIVVETFLSANDRISGRSFLTPKQREWVDVQGKAHILPFKKQPEPPQNQPVRAALWRLVRWPYFERIILSIIAVNTVFLATLHYNQSAAWTHVLDVADYVFGSVYIFEAVVKIFVLRIGYFLRLRNLFDFFIVVTIVVAWVYAGASNGDTFTVFASLRVLRVFRLALLVRGVNLLMTTLRFAIPAILNVGVLLFLLYFIYACMGVQLFYGFPSTPWQYEYANFVNNLQNFDSFGNAFVTLFRMSTLSTWNGVEHDLATVTWLIYPYSISFIFLMVYVLLNLFVAVLLGNFTSVISRSTHQTVSQASLVEYRRVWAELAHEYRAEYKAMLVKRLRGEGTAEATEDNGRDAINDSQLELVMDEVLAPTMLPASYFVKVFERLTPPLGLSMVAFLSRAQVIAHVSTLNIPLTPSGMIGYKPTLKALVDRAVLQSTKEQLAGDGLMTTALDIALRLQSRSSSKRLVDFEHSASSHDLSHEIAARRVQLSGRYVLGREAVERRLADGLISEDEASRQMHKLRVDYTRRLTQASWTQHKWMM